MGQGPAQTAPEDVKGLLEVDQPLGLGGRVLGAALLLVKTAFENHSYSAKSATLLWFICEQRTNMYLRRD